MAKNCWENQEQLLVLLQLRSAFLQKELLEFLFSFYLKSVGSGRGDRRGKNKGGEEQVNIRKLRYSGGAIEGGGMRCKHVLASEAFNTWKSLAQYHYYVLLNLFIGQKYWYMLEGIDIGIRVIRVTPETCLNLFSFYKWEYGQAVGHILLFFWHLH